MMKITHINYHVLKDGQIIAWDLNYDFHTGRVRADPKFRGEFSVNGRSILNLLDEYDDVFLVKNPVDL
jgi:hypothetical protein